MFDASTWTCQPVCWVLVDAPASARGGMPFPPPAASLRVTCPQLIMHAPLFLPAAQVCGRHQRVPCDHPQDLRGQPVSFGGESFDSGMGPCPWLPCPAADGPAPCLTLARPPFSTRLHIQYHQAHQRRDLHLQPSHRAALPQDHPHQCVGRPEAVESAGQVEDGGGGGSADPLPAR